MDCQGALAAAIVVAGAFYIVNGKLGGKIYSTTNYIKNRYGQKLSAYIITSLTGWLCLQNTVHTGRTVLCRQVQKNIFRNTFISILLRTISSEVIELMIHISHLHRILYPELYHSENFRKQ